MKDDKGERLVNAPAPKPMRDDVLVPKDVVERWQKVAHHFNQDELFALSDEAAKALRRHQQSAEPVAWYDLPMANIELADAIVQEWQKRVESGAPAMPWGTGELVELISKLRPAAFPGPSELVERPNPETQAVAKIRELEKEFRETAETLAGTASAAGVLACADRLSAVIRGEK